MQTITQVFHVAIEGRSGDAQFFQKYGKRHDVAVMQNLFDFIEAFRAIHVLGSLGQVSTILPQCPRLSVGH
jgi:hypothetical protein